jgi:hypothetical protein
VPQPLRDQETTAMPVLDLFDIKVQIFCVEFLLSQTEAAL